MLRLFEVKSIRRFHFISIKKRIEQYIQEMSIEEAILMVQCPCSSVALTMVKDQDDLKNDVLYGMEKAFNTRDEFYHSSLNSAAHLKAMNLGNTLFLLVKNHQLILEKQEDICLIEFDGPQTHQVYIKKLNEGN